MNIQDNEKIEIINVGYGWIPCKLKEPDNENNIVIAYWNESDNIWQYWMYKDCPFGWNVLCKSMSYWKELINPFLSE